MELVRAPSQASDGVAGSVRCYVWGGVSEAERQANRLQALTESAQLFAEASHSKARVSGSYNGSSRGMEVASGRRAGPTWVRRSASGYRSADRANADQCAVTGKSAVANSKFVESTVLHEL
jgi:hypothetical protein